MRIALGAMMLATLALCACNAGEDRPATDNTAATAQAPADPAGEAGQPAGVPERFRGVWAQDAEACTRPAELSRLEIDGDRIRFYESSGPVVAVDADGDTLQLTARLTGEGETRDAPHAFTLSADGDTLTDANGYVRVRCDG